MIVISEFSQKIVYATATAFKQKKCEGNVKLNGKTQKQNRHSFSLQKVVKFNVQFF
jgi:hypothetical protein